MILSNRSYYLPLIALAGALIVSSIPGLAQSGKRHKKIEPTNERSLKVTIEAGLGDVTIAKSKGGNILEATVESDRTINLDDCIDYEIRDRVGFLNFTSDCDDNSKKHVKKSKTHFSDFESSDWWLNITDDVPISFDFELGMGKADINMTGLSVKDLNLSTGASSVTLRFDEPNKSTIEDMSIEAGLSKFRAEGLGYANFNYFKFDGGLGTYVLDFSGNLTHEADVDIEIGLGSVTIIIPKNVGVKVFCEKNWISHLNIDEDDFTEREDDTYYTSNYSSASGKMNMHVEAGMGSVKIKRE
ncbi:MAG: hypothetical protein EPO24_05100 [Bacteroidetes bacterium]|nr:MAG: hypothetical protein EPO24_05100 [Bacteroidota bacterium]